MLESFRGLRKFYRRFLPFSNKRVGLFSRQDAKNAKFGKHLFLCGLCAFARDIPIFDCGFAALGALWLIPFFLSASQKVTRFAVPNLTLAQPKDFSKVLRVHFVAAHMQRNQVECFGI